MTRSLIPRELLIIFTRFPVPGQAKTRLIPALGAKGAADLQMRMSEYTFAQCRKLAAQRLLKVEVFYTGGTESEVKKWLPVGMIHQPQCLGDLGKRIEHAFDHGFWTHMERVIVVGADCPSLTPEIMTEAFKCLKKKDLVLGPAKDGGCYLIGLRKQTSFLWENIDWGTEHVLKQIMAKAKKLNVSHSLLEPLGDIDLPEDLLEFFQEVSWLGSSLAVTS